MGQYDSAFAKDTRDLVAAAHKGELPAIQFRDDEIAAVLEHVRGGRSVLVTGPVGAGKTAVIHGVAHALAESGTRGLRQTSCSQVMADTKYIGEWQTKVTRIAEAAEEANASLFFTDVWNIATVGKTSNDPSCLLDALRPFLEAGRVSLVGEASAEMLRAIQRVPGFGALFQHVAVNPLPAESVDAILTHASKRDGLQLEPGARQALLKTTTRFLPSRPQPGPALNLLRQVRDYHAQEAAAGEVHSVTPEFVDKVFSIYTGLPLFVVSPRTAIPAREIRAWFQDRLVGQSEAIEAVLEAITLFKAGMHDPNKPIGTFLFVGPTGVGKTELARLLATFLFGSASRMLRFDLSEFKDYHSFELLIGDPGKPQRPARLIDPVRVQPFQVVLFDELEKAHSNVWDLFLQLLDEGRLTPPGGQPVNFRNTLVIATSNVGARTADKSMGFGAEPDPGAREASIRKALEAAFRPEFLNRFQHTAIFHHLTAEQIRTVARHELTRILDREGITGRNLVVDVAPEALDLVIERAYDPRYGARALKREIQRQLVLPIAMTLMERVVEAGSILRVLVKQAEIHVRVLETEASRTAKREREPVAVPEGGKLSRAEILHGLGEARAEIEALARDVDEPFLDSERSQLLESRRDPEFWNHPEHAALALRDLDRVNTWLHRIDRLRARADDIEAVLTGADLRREVAQAANRFAQLKQSIVVGRRELVTMGSRGLWDALIEISPLGDAGRMARDLLVETYTRWAQGRRMKVDRLREPAADAEPAMLAVQGMFAYGLLGHERGLHRVRDGESHGVARVRVAPWTEIRWPVKFLSHRALKTEGQFGGRLRSRLECANGLVLQNGKTLTENRERAAELSPSWEGAKPAPDDIVRRYDVSPNGIRDVLTGFSSGRPDALGPKLFHDLLCARVDAAGGPG